MTRRREAFLDAYFGIAKLNGQEAARIAGFRHPRTAGPYLLRKMSDVVEQRLVAFRSAKVLSADEVNEIIAEIARDPQHKDRLKAVELAARINGQLSDKLSVTIDRKQIQSELDAEFTVIRAALPPPPALGSEPKAPS